MPVLSVYFLTYRYILLCDIIYPLFGDRKLDYHTATGLDRARGDSILEPLFLWAKLSNESRDRK